MPTDDDWLARIVNALDVGVFTVDHVEQRFLRMNEACARILGFKSAEEGVGRSLLELYADPKERLEIASRFAANEEFKRTGIARLEGRRLRYDTREPFDALISVLATFDENGRVVRMDGVIQAIGERAGVERAFRASEERFRILFDTSAVAMALTDRKGCMTRVNAAFARFVGRPERELLGTDLLALVHEESRPARPIPDETVKPAEHRFARADGADAWGHVTWSWLSDDGGAPHSAVVVVQDMTERRRAEQTLLRIAKLESLGVLAAGIAHDFNNVLAVVLGSLTLAARQPDAGAHTRHILEDAEKAVGRARDLARQLVTFSKGGAPKKEVASLGVVVREAAELCARGSNAELAIDVDADLWPVEIDAGQMSQVFHNLFINAIQAMPSGGAIRVHLGNVVVDGADTPPFTGGRYVRARVSDDGEGIDAEDLERIFDPYFTTKPTGTGLGLAMAHSIIARHGGHITVDSARGRGTTFTVDVPACEARVAPAPPRPISAAPPLSARVLVMDDEEGVRNVAARILKAGGLRVDMAKNGEEAIAAYRAAMGSGERYGAVVLDLTIRGGMGGVETLARIRELDPDARAVVASGYSDGPVMSAFRAHGFDAAVEKPFTLAELTRAVRDALSVERRGL